MQKIEQNPEVFADFPKIHSELGSNVQLLNDTLEEFKQVASHSLQGLKQAVIRGDAERTDAFLKDLRHAAEKIHAQPLMQLVSRTDQSVSGEAWIKTYEDQLPVIETCLDRTINAIDQHLTSETNSKQNDS